MREIEVKAHLHDHEAFLAAAAAEGIEFGPPIRQEDVTYLNGTPYGDPAWSIVRLRTQAGRSIMTMKFKASDRARDNHELETEVGKPDQAQKMLERFGYKRHVRIAKTRRFAHFDGLELCYDEVDGVGWLAEVEKLTDESADVDAIQAELWALLKKLGVRDEDRELRGYDQIIAQLQGVDKPEETNQAK